MAKLGHVFWPVLGRPVWRARSMRVPGPMSWRVALAINARVVSCHVRLATPITLHVGDPR
eukprot:1471091-Lingulodinium_polyedra.AAC.1